ncbi:MAG TPA: hypothetical protein VF602_07715 [Pedobacter sp.]|jgi:uncharacterized protein YjhX (UPF0386 family)
MKSKLRILKVLEAINRANSKKIEVIRLELLLNTSLFNTENDEPLWAHELLNSLQEMKDEKLISQDDQKKYSITQKGLEYIEQTLD